MVSNMQDEIKTGINRTLVCDKCGKDFILNSDEKPFKRKVVEIIGHGLCNMEYFECPHCKTIYPVFILEKGDEKSYKRFLKLQKWLIEYQKKTKEKGTTGALIKEWNVKYKKYKKLKGFLFHKHKTLSKIYVQNL